MSVRLVAGTVVTIAIVGAAAFFVQRAIFAGDEDNGPEPQRYGEVALQGVPLDELPGDFRFSAPLSNYKPKISSRKAFSIARDYRHIDARQILLASVQSDGSDSTSTHAWIVNFDPSDTAGYGLCAASITYSVYVLDAEDGHFLTGTTVFDPSPQCRYPAGISPVP